MWEPMVDIFGIKPATTCLQVPYLMYLKMNKIRFYTYIYTSYTQHRHTSSVILWYCECEDAEINCMNCFVLGFFFLLRSKKTVFAGAAGSVCCQKRVRQQRSESNLPKQDTMQPWSSTQHKDQLPELRAVSTKATVHQKWSFCTNNENKSFTHYIFIIAC